MKKSNPQKKSLHGDMHPADIKADLEKAGWTLRKLSLHAGYSNANTVNQALHRPYPKAEAIIAEALGKRPEEIWPSRYQDKNKQPKKTNQQLL